MAARAPLLSPGKVYGNRVPLPLCTPPSPRSTARPLPLCLKLPLPPCHTKFKFMTTAARWRCMCQTLRAAHFKGSRSGVGEMKASAVLNSDGGSVARWAWPCSETTCNRTWAKVASFFLLSRSFLFSCLRSFWHYFGVANGQPSPARNCFISRPFCYFALCRPAPAACHANKFKYALCGCRLNKFVSPRRVLCNSPQRRHVACGLGQVTIPTGQLERGRALPTVSPSLSCLEINMK